ncbi:MAG: hypothetical protein A3B91_05055 [Candidatus Yanofskybacteria bacterium RIFCSPHIGHO2_02_FULL_41_29]|uniref:Uncharacterized protein n=2 Tax=Patescibacteria group TaxID=1783273 RepID=A0A1F5NJ20_9BACT|nr:MAG: hypothetical protein A3J19_03170 [Candidatus Daviesbacteria bacterium RIFCSPLOWO2_02_FULL_41_8]OGN00689.1 MAG: hypothetical protein A2650_04055 [Candidatus Yanofskybacteria bacterium RIFCSPHIGHO2_01_FULL_41_53]OGN11664.1 MAG: hypothetical protein A3B91_05055 [Candidatus Yanofskybacteria bacterium RIFCSPHIGHO2_02_FULL_41_29]OGN23424.1 MAG: hypothetical protein A2916_03445 [Candidatus Yanofskybacteria bacterium RIFCSPLOWO2_01_FULL_41_67]
MISKEALEQFKEIYKLEYGEELPDDLAEDLAFNYLNLFDQVYRPIKQEWADEYPEKSNDNGP